jgi:hypothetical protein
LSYGINLIVWKAILNGEILAEIAARRLKRIECKPVARNNRQNYEDADRGFPQLGFL